MPKLSRAWLQLCKCRSCFLSLRLGHAVHATPRGHRTSRGKRWRLKEGYVVRVLDTLLLLLVYICLYFDYLRLISDTSSAAGALAHGLWWRGGHCELCASGMLWGPRWQSILKTERHLTIRKCLWSLFQRLFDGSIWLVALFRTRFIEKSWACHRD